jgi:AraC-like DNA-binding protein
MQDLTRDLGPDVLSDVLHAVRFRGTVMCKSSLRAPWGFAVEGRDFASFHHVVRGAAVLEVDGVPEVRWLRQGDLVVLPHGNAHVVRDAPGSRVTGLDVLAAEGEMDARGNLRGGGKGPETVLVCGGFHADDRRANPVLAALPAVLHLRSAGPNAVWLRTALRFLASESGSSRPGASTLVSRLADVVFIEAVRAYFASAEADRSGMRVALDDPRIGAAVAAIHRAPEKDWELGSLARLAGMSRTAFSLRFRTIVGDAPLRYVAAQRIEKAQRLLRESRATIAEIAQATGYESEVGFHRAFKRRVGEAPAAYRRLHQKRIASLSGSRASRRSG